MGLLQFIDELKGYQEIIIVRQEFKDDEEGNSKLTENKIYSGTVNNFNPKVNEIRGLRIEFVYFGSEKVSITVR